MSSLLSSAFLSGSASLIHEKERAVVAVLRSLRARGPRVRATRRATPWRRPRLVHTSRKGAGRPEGLVHKSAGPSRIAPWTRPGHSFPDSSHPAQRPRRAVTLFFSLPSGRPGAARGMFQAGRRGSSARPTTRPCCPVRPSGGRRPRDHGAPFGRCDVPEGGTRLKERCRSLRRTRRPAGRTPCPGSPEAPSGPPGRSGVQPPPLRPATGRHPPAPARR